MSDFVKASHVFVDVDAATVDEALEFLAKKAAELGICDTEEHALAGLKERESLGPTGMQHGFAIPHCKSDAVNGAAIIAVKFANDVSWESMDGKPIKTAVALFVPNNRVGTTYLRILSQIAVMLMSEEYRERITSSDDPKVIAAVLNEGIEV